MLVTRTVDTIVDDETKKQAQIKQVLEGSQRGEGTASSKGGSITPKFSPRAASEKIWGWAGTSRGSKNG